MTHHEQNLKINYKLSFVCFVIPIAAFLVAFVNGQNEGLLGMLLCFFAAIYVVGLLLLKPPLQQKHAAWSFLLDYFLSLLFFTLIAFGNLYGQQSPWFN